MKDSFGKEFTTDPTKTNASLNEATSSAHSAIDSAAAKAKPAIDRAATMVHDAADTVAHAGTKAADWLGEKGVQLSEGEKKLIDYVQANPLKAVGIALVAGAVIARIL